MYSEDELGEGSDYHSIVIPIRPRTIPTKPLPTPTRPAPPVEPLFVGFDADLVEDVVVGIVGVLVVVVVGKLLKLVLIWENCGVLEVNGGGAMIGVEVVVTGLLPLPLPLPFPLPVPFPLPMVTPLHWALPLPSREHA